MPSDRLNILHFICHDIGKHMGCYGVPVATPNLDRFAEQSVLFEKNFCNSPACSPSRACMMSGRYAHTTGAVGLSHMGWPLDLKIEGIVDWMNHTGYETILSGINHERHPQTDRYAVDLPQHWDDWLTHRAVDRAVDHLQRRDRDKPFYLHLSSQQPHASTWHRVDTLHGGAVAPDDVWVPLWLPDTPHIREQFGKFQAAIRFMDEQFGRLMAALDTLDYADNTLVVFTTDHGISAPRSKGTLYDRGVEIALLVRMPDGSGAGRRVTDLTQNIDYAPTFLDAIGAEKPSVLQGRSLWPLLTGGTWRPHDAIFTERNFHGERPFRGADHFIDEYDPIRAIRTRDFHYIRRYRPEIKSRVPLPMEVPAHGRSGEQIEYIVPETNEPRETEELYHVDHDGLEMINVARRPEYAEVKQRLARRMHDWMVATDDFVLRDQPPARPEEPSWGPHWPVVESA